jgi:hypothetical protein
MVQESHPLLRTTMQGELLRDGPDWHLLYSLVDAPMREALARESFEVSGWMARELVRHYADPSSFEDILAIQDMWPGHIIEFSCFNRPVGCLGQLFHRCVIIWEVRYH